jgi:hypothetical protein
MLRLQTQATTSIRLPGFVRRALQPRLLSPALHLPPLRCYSSVQLLTYPLMTRTPRGSANGPACRVAILHLFDGQPYKTSKSPGVSGRKTAMRLRTCTTPIHLHYKSIGPWHVLTWKPSKPHYGTATRGASCTM